MREFFYRDIGDRKYQRIVDWEVKFFVIKGNNIIIVLSYDRMVGTFAGKQYIFIKCTAEFYQLFFKSV